MKKIEYIAPQKMETKVAFEGLLCASIVKSTFFVEVDEYVNTDEEEIVFDGFDF